MIDWLTMRIPHDSVSDCDLETLREKFARITKTTGDGEIVWSISARESVRSDSHQTQIHYTANAVEISGTPARVMGVDNVFGSGDPAECANAMVFHVNEVLGLSLPMDVKKWRVSRVDVTHNYALSCAADVRQALGYLRHAEGGRFQVRTSSDTVYWSPQSRVRSAKAYAKGPHLEYQQRKGQATFTDDQHALASRILRLELSLKAEFWRRNKVSIWDMTESQLDTIHNEFFAQMVGRLEVKDMNTLLEQCEKTAKTKGQGAAAYRTYALVAQIGEHTVRNMMPRATWMRHRKVLFDAGLTFADLNEGKILPFRSRVIELAQPVRSWDELRAAA